MSEIQPLQVKSGNTNVTLSLKDDNFSIESSTSTNVIIHALIGVKKLCLKSFEFVPVDMELAASWTKSVKNAAYKNAKPSKHLKIFINPFSGTCKASKVFDSEVKPIFDAAGCTYDITITEKINHAREIMQTIDLKPFDVIVGISGDGIIHEIINGLLERENINDATIPIGVIPAGSGNALNICLQGEAVYKSLQHSALTIIKGVPMKIDMCSITQGDKRYFSFMSQTFGVIADCDLGTENLRWMGSMRFIFGALKAIFEGRRYSCELAMKIAESNKEIIRDTYRKEYNSNSQSVPMSRDNRYGTVNDPIPDDWTIITDDVSTILGGKVPWIGKGTIPFPCALPNDGLIDLLVARRDKLSSRIKSINFMTEMELGNHIKMKEIDYYKVEAFRLTPKNSTDGYISIDGEKVDFAPFQVEALPQLINILSIDGKYQYVNI
ncbi:22507_t:CDS:2 [Dentiscutata erythropus]|uniref:22507_t:CDS:1 n=1 Tax=Dentiscutata erythropus TaxID=1348616 RepID=A0A9N9CDQ2_9GLOM|nr:22507_t:CDS:2 [Dentiscutata erythropus]